MIACIMSDSKVVSAWGYTFELTQDHLSPAQMEPLKFSYDLLGEKVFIRLNDISASQRQKRRGDDHARRDLYTLLEENVSSDPLLTQLWDEVTHVPPWIDWKQIQRGQECCKRRRPLSSFKARDDIGQPHVLRDGIFGFLPSEQSDRLWP